MLQENISSPVEIDVTNINFTSLASMPNFTLPPMLAGRINKPRYSEYDIIISTGRKLAKMLNLAKKQFGNANTKLITILNPNMKFSNFDAVLLPNHDDILDKDDNNVVNFNGSLVYLETKEIKLEYKKWNTVINRFHKPYIGLIIGGDSKHGKLKYQDCEDLVKTANTIAHNMDGTLLITTSRRTPDYFQEIARNNLTCSYYLFDYNNACNPKHNPYTAYLGISDYFIITGDSISMISELCETSKPVYLYINGICGKKHLKFIEITIQNNSTRILTPDLHVLTKFTSKSINNKAIIVQRILQKINFLK